MTIILSDGYTDLEQNIVDNTDTLLNCLYIVVTGKWMVDNLTDVWVEKIEPTKEALDALVNELSETAVPKDEFQLYSVSIGDMFDYEDYINREGR